MLLLFCIVITVHPSLLQPPLPLSLPVHMSVTPPGWQFLPLSQAELSPLFSNSSPFSFSQSLFILPPPSWAPRLSLQATFGPYSVTQLISEPVLPLAPTLSASLLSQHIEREKDEGGQERFRVRVLFHQRGDTSTRGTCITLHALRETEEHKASCTTEPSLGLCVVTLTLPSDWFEDEHSNQSNQDLDQEHVNIHPRRRVQKRERQWGGYHRSKSVSYQHGTSSLLRYHPDVNGMTQADVPWALRYPRGPMRNQIQLYYSSFDTVADPKLTPSGCVEERAAQSQVQLFHIKAVTLREEQEQEKEEEQSTTKEEEDCSNEQEEEELDLDSHVTIRYHRGPVILGKPIRVSVNLRANFTAEIVVIRLKIKKGLVSMVAQRTLTSELWAVSLERSQGSQHDTVSILCHRHSKLKHIHNPTLLQHVVCLSVDGLKRSFGVAMVVSAHWLVEYSGRNNPSLPRGAAVTMFSFTDRPISGIAPITESNTIINTAILTNQPVSLPVIVLAITRDGKMSDVTSAVTCYSTNENTVKVSSNCSTLFVDGSESGVGSTCVVVDFLLGTLRGSVCLQVWAPSVPLRMSLVDPVLNAIEGWNHFTDKGCEPVYQRTSVQVLTQFTAQDSESRTTFLLGSSDWFVDVTELVLDWLRVEDPRVASLGPHNNLIGLRPGKTSLHVISEQWDGMMGRCDVTVTSEPVVPGDLSVQVVSGLGMSNTGSPTHPSIVTTTVTAYHILYNHHQEASISIWLQFSDDTASLLSSFSDLSYYMRLSSLAETVVVVAPGSSQRIFARGDGGGPLLLAELLVSTCTDKLITSNSISDVDWDWMDTGGGAGTRRLAKGSGWIRVNLELDFLHPTGNKDEDGEDFEFDISDSDVYAFNFDEDSGGNESNDYYDRMRGRLTNRKWDEAGNTGMVSRNNLERAILTPSLEEGSVHFAPSQEKQGERDKEQGDRELELGVGAVLSLLCLSAFLFLANCLPCAMRDKRGTRAEEVKVRDLEEGTKEGEVGEEEEEEEEKKAEKKDRTMQQNWEEEVKVEVEIIC